MHDGAPAAPDQPSGRAYLKLVAVGAAIGIPAALVAAGFLALVHAIERQLWTELPKHLGHTLPPWYLVIGLPVAGGVIVFIARRWLPGDGGHEPLDGLSTKPTIAAYAPGVALAAIGTLSFGAVLGPEGPVIALGSVVGVIASRIVKAGEKPTQVLSLAGSFSAISALFGGPLVAGMLLMEGAIGLGAAMAPVLLPGLVAAACGYVIFIGVGSWSGFPAYGLTVTDLPAYTNTSFRDLGIAIAVGLVSAVLLSGIRGAGHSVKGLRGRGVGMLPLLAGGGLAVGALAMLARALGDNSQDVLFSGQTSVGVVVAETSTKLVLVLIVCKGIAYAISLGCGFRGGPIFPAIFLGCGIASLPVVWFGMSPTVAIAMGAAAGMASQTRLLFAPVLFAELLVGHGGGDATPAAALATVAAWLVTKALDERAAAAAEPAAHAS